MKTIKTKLAFAVTMVLSIAVLFSCKEENKNEKQIASTQETIEEPVAVTHVMTKEDQERLTPQM